MNKMFNSTLCTPAIGVDKPKSSTHLLDLDNLSVIPNATPLINGQISKSSISGTFKTPAMKDNSFQARNKTPRSIRSSATTFRTPINFKRNFSSQLKTPIQRQLSGSAKKTPNSGLASTLRAPRSGRSNAWTPGSATPRTEDCVPPSTIVSLIEGRGHAKGEVGLAAIHLNQPLMTLTQFSDTQTYTKTLSTLAILNPMEVILSSSGQNCGVSRVIHDSVQSARITSVHRQYFSEVRGLTAIKQMSAENTPLLAAQISSKYYCLASAAALIKYIEHSQQLSYASSSLRIRYTAAENTMAIEHYSVRELELVRSLDGSWEKSLFGVLKHTKTPSGTRLLRASLLQPSACRNTIESRLNALEYLVTHANVFHSVQNLLSRLPDLDWLLTMCVQDHKQDSVQRSEQRLNYVIGLKITLEMLVPLVTCLEGVEDPLLATIRQSVQCQSVTNVAEVVQKVIHDDAKLVNGSVAMRNQRCYAIKTNINGCLDISRQIYSEIIDDITSHVTEVCEEFSVQGRVGHSDAKGFHIIVPWDNKKNINLPPTFIQVQKYRGGVTCTTERLYQLDQRSREIMKEVLAMSNAIVCEVITEVRDKVVALHSVAEAVAALDLIVSLTHASSLGGWMRPVITDDPRECHLRVIRGKHPILDLTAHVPPVANDTVVTKKERALIITGPNMSGKSTYLRQVALLQVLAQIGCFVPAAEATFSIKRQLFALLSAQDSLEHNASTFQMQMVQMSGVLQQCSASSLVLLDELASGTSTAEGVALSWAVLEALLLSNAAVLVATHFRALSNISALYPVVKNLHQIGSESDTLRHTMRSGSTPVAHYGLTAASLTSLPHSILAEARIIASSDQLGVGAGVTPSAVIRTRTAALRLASELTVLAEEGTDTVEGNEEGMEGNGEEDMEGNGEEVNVVQNGDTNGNAAEKASAIELRNKVEKLLEEFLEKTQKK